MTTSRITSRFRLYAGWTLGAKSRVSSLITTCLMLVLAVPSATTIYAQPRPGEDRTQDEAREAFLHQGIKPFAEIMAIARRRAAGEFVKIELKRKKHGWEYKVRILTPQGRRIEMKIDAMSGEVLEIE